MAGDCELWLLPSTQWHDHVFWVVVDLEALEIPLDTLL